MTDVGFDSDPDWQPGTADACANGRDDDGDGDVDLGDLGCTSATDPDETRADTACDDGIDDDGDGLVDFDDPACEAGWPYWESPPACGLGGELVLLYAVARWIARRRAAAWRPILT